MRFLMTTSAGDPPDEKMMTEMGRLVEELSRAGVLLATGGLGQEGTRITSNGGKITVTDGPFTETKEHLGGFTVVDVPDDDEARYWAGRIAVAVGWPQEMHRFPHRIPLSTDTQSEALS